VLSALYRNKRLLLEDPLDLPDGTRVVLQVRTELPSSVTETEAVTRIQALYKRKVLLPKSPLKMQEGSMVTILALIPVRSLKSFQGILRDLKQDSVTLQHKAMEWWI